MFEIRGKDSDRGTGIRARRGGLGLERARGRQAATSWGGRRGEALKQVAARLRKARRQWSEAVNLRPDSAATDDKIVEVPSNGFGRRGIFWCSRPASTKFKNRRSAARDLHGVMDVKRHLSQADGRARPAADP